MKELNEITQDILDVAFDVHTQLGPGLFEIVYRKCLKEELSRIGYKVDDEVSFPVYYSDYKIDTGFRLDLLVDNRVIVELKACEKLYERHKMQLLTYLKLTGLQVGLLLNFNEQHLRNGIKRVVNNYRGPNPRDSNLARDQ